MALINKYNSSAIERTAGGVMFLLFASYVGFYFLSVGTATGRERIWDGGEGVATSLRRAAKCASRNEVIDALYLCAAARHTVYTRWALGENFNYEA